MYINLSVPNMSIKENMVMTRRIEDRDFPVLTIDKDSYIVSACVETGLDFRLDDGVYNLQIGKYTSVAEDVLFMIDIDHDYLSIYQGVISEYGIHYGSGKRKRKGQILIQNDCWIGRGATIMNGVTIHNGAVVAAGAVVTKDVPPYSIVAGNPARVVKKRFCESDIQALLKIQWWNWSSDQLISRKADLQGDIAAFVNTYLSGAEQNIERLMQRNNPVMDLISDGPKYGFCVDDDSNCPLWKRIVHEFCKTYNHQNGQLILYVPNWLSNKEYTIERIVKEFDEYAELDFCAQIIDGDETQLEEVVQNVDCWITNREYYNISLTCYADLCGVRIISGVDIPVFG